MKLQEKESKKFSQKRKAASDLILPEKKIFLYFVYKLSYIHRREMIFTLPNRTNISLSIGIRLLKKGLNGSIEEP